MTWPSFGINLPRILSRILPRILLRTLLGVLLINPSFSLGASQNFSKVQKLITQAGMEEAFQELTNMPAHDLSPEDRYLRAFTMAFVSQELGHYEKIPQWIAEDKSPLRKTYHHFLLGQRAYKRQNYKVATQEFQTLIASKPTANILYESHFWLGQIALQKKQWSIARKHFRLIERKWKNTPKHPQALWSLIKIEKERKQKKTACQWARKLYIKYPAHALIYDWDIDLKKANYEGQNLGCTVTSKDQAQRVRRLQWSGESKRAQEELEALQKTATTPQAKYDVDTIFANFFINEGYIHKAMNILLKYYEPKKNDFDYLMLLAKVMSKAGQYPTAVGTYYKGYKLKPKGKQGRKALFSAAFLSYQFQDYDGATKKFEEFIRVHRRSGLRQDAQYHLAWLQYLKGDHQGAIKKFNDILKKKKQHRRLWRKYPMERINYWLAMSHMHLKNYKEAHKLFQKLTQNNDAKGFYSVAANYRFQLIPSYISHHKVNPKVKNGQSLPVNMETLPSSPIQPPSEGKISPNKLQKRFERALSLTKVGLWKWARWELYEIETRTKHRPYLKKLVKVYEEIGSFHRSAYISATYLRGERNKGGSGPLWFSAYPQAYKNLVYPTAKEFDIPTELIWSIMRAETFFRIQAISPVGAKGLMQLMPYTARKVASLMKHQSFRENQLLEPKMNIRLGGRYLKRLLTKFKGSIPLTAAAYNAGPHRVEDWIGKFGILDIDEFIEHIPFVETRNYVKKVVSHFHTYKKLYSKEAKSLACLTQPVGIKAKQTPSTRETWEPLHQ